MLYWGLRSYRIDPVTWPDGWVGDLGLEPTVEAYVAHLVEVFGEVRRVLRDDGCVFVNLGDSYAGSQCGSHDYRPEGASLSKSDAKYQGQKPPADPGLKPLDLCGVPERFALAMQAEGWWWRDRIAYCKTSAMPESVAGWRWERCRVRIKAQGKGYQSRRVGLAETIGIEPQRDSPGGAWQLSAQWADCPGCPKCAPNGGLVLRRGAWRTTRAWEYIFMFTKSAEYFCDSEAVKEALSPLTLADKRNATGRHTQGDTHGTKYGGVGSPDSPSWYRSKTFVNPEQGRNPRSWWVIGPEPCNWDFCLACGFFAAQGVRGKKRTCPSCGATDAWVDHYALFPPELPKRCILAATSEKGCCPTCGAPWAPVVERGALREHPQRRNRSVRNEGNWQAGLDDYTENGGTLGLERDSRITSWRPTCGHGGESVPATVLDPFCGASSTGLAALRLGRSYIGLELSAPYVALSWARLRADAPMMLQGAADA